MSYRTAARSGWGPSALDGVMPEWSTRLERRPGLDFVDYSLRGVGQIVFLNNPLSGLLILIGMWVFSTWLGFAATLGVLVSTAAALLLGLDRTAIRAGLYGFNGALAGAGLATFMAPGFDAAVMGYIVVAAGLSTVLMAALSALLLPRFNIPPLTLPFNLAALMFLFAAFSFAGGHLASSVEPQMPMDSQPTVNTTLRATPEGAGASDVPALLNAVFRGLSELFLADSVVTGVLVLAGMLVCSRIAAGFALVGSVIGLLTALAVGADGFDVYHGLWGFNSFISAVAIAGVFYVLSWRSALLAVACAAAAAFLFGALSTLFSPWGLPALTLPFCLATLAFLLLKDLSPRFAFVAPADVTTPEEHLRLHRPATDKPPDRTGAGAAPDR